VATSNSTDFSLNRDQIIYRALRLLGVLSQGETPTSDQVSEASVALNALVKAWQADGMPLWALKTYSVTLTAANSFEIGVGKTVNTPKPLKVIQAWYRNTSSSIDIPVHIVTKDEYNRLGNKTSSGSTPSQIYYEPRLDSGMLYVYPQPDANAVANGTLYIVYQRPFEDFDSSTDTPDFPQEWYDAITYGLACRLAPEYGLPPNDRKLLWQEMTIIKNEALSFGTEEGSLYFQVDRRGW
jgi:hypothetical protein